MINIEFNLISSLETDFVVLRELFACSDTQFHAFRFQLIVHITGLEEPFSSRPDTRSWNASDLLEPVDRCVFLSPLSAAFQLQLLLRPSYRTN